MPVLPEPPAPRPVAFTLRGTPDLNQGNAVVVRIYTLRGNTALPQATLPALWADDASALRGDLVGREELRLYPGDTRDVTVNVAPEAAYVAVVANLRAAEGQDGMHGFPADALSEQGAVVIIGADRVDVAGE